MLSKLGEKEHQAEGKSMLEPPVFFRTHPLTDDRVKRVVDQMPQVGVCLGGCTIRGLLISTMLSQALEVYQKNCGVARASFERDWRWR